MDGDGGGDLHIMTCTGAGNGAVPRRIPVRDPRMSPDFQRRLRVGLTATGCGVRERIDEVCKTTPPPPREHGSYPTSLDSARPCGCHAWVDRVVCKLRNNRLLEGNADWDWVSGAQLPVPSGRPSSRHITPSTQDPIWQAQLRIRTSNSNGSWSSNGSVRPAGTRKFSM